MPRLDAIPRRIVTLTLPPPYDVFTVRAWINYPTDIVPPPGSLVDLFDFLIVDHDIEGDDGNLLPTGRQEIKGEDGRMVRAPGFWEGLKSNDFRQAIWQAIMANVGVFTTPPSIVITRSGGGSNS